MQVYIMFCKIHLQFAVTAFPEIFLIITVVILINFEVLITEVMNISPLYTGKHVSLHLALPSPLRRCSE